jgi:hypothetical protein
MATLMANRSKVLWSVVGWLVVFVFFFPVLWMWLESLKTEPQAASSPPTILFVPTLEEFQTVLSGDFPPFFINSAAGRLRARHQAGQADAGCAVLLHLDSIPAVRREPSTALLAGS